VFPKLIFIETRTGRFVAIGGADTGAHIHQPLDFLAPFLFDHLTRTELCFRICDGIITPRA
jgi:hypothetical protein